MGHISVWFFFLASSVVGINCSAVIDPNQHFKFMGSLRSSQSRSGFGIQSTKGKNYFVSRSQSTVGDARFLCHLIHGGTLLTIESENENNFIIQATRRDSLENFDIWTDGYYDYYSDTYLWDTTGDFVRFQGTSSWGPNQPFVKHDTYPLAFRIARGGQMSWSVVWQGEQNYYICQVEF